MKNKKMFLCFLFVFVVVFMLQGCTLFCQHDFDEVIVNPTCTENGLSTKTCTKCGKVKKTKIDKLGHDVNDSTVVIDSTCNEEGTSIGICNRCKEEVTIIIPKKQHQFKVVVTNPTCIDEGHTSNVCELCGYEEILSTVEALGHNFINPKEIKKATDVQNGLIEETCSRCDLIRYTEVLSISYIDLDIINMNFDFTKEIVITDRDQLRLLYKTCVFQKRSEVSCKLDFEIGDFNQLNDYISNINLKFPYQCQIRLNGKMLTLAFTYSDSILHSTEEPINHNQIRSLNTSSNLITRSEDYDDFKINLSQYTYEVETSNQLLYCIERRVKPLVKENSEAKIVYDEAKKVLKEIINDNMTDIEKVKAIHDWLVINVTYDSKVYELSFTEENLKGYKSFLLEGVFLEKLAVCDGISKAFSLMANIEGIPCVQVTGYSKDKVGHAWNKVYVLNDWYIIDCTSDNVILNNDEVLSYGCFLVSDEQFNNKYTASDYYELKCTKSYNIYNDIQLKSSNKSIDLSIDNYQELVDLIKFIKTVSSSDYTIEFYITYLNSNAEVTQEVNKALKDARIFTSYSYYINSYDDVNYNLYTFIERD